MYTKWHTVNKTLYTNRYTVIKTMYTNWHTVTKLEDTITDAKAYAIILLII